MVFLSVKASFQDLLIETVYKGILAFLFFTIYDM